MLRALGATCKKIALDDKYTYHQLTIGEVVRNRGLPAKGLGAEFDKPYICPNSLFEAVEISGLDEVGDDISDQSHY